MRPVVARLLLAGAVVYLGVALWPLERDTRLVALSGFVVFVLLYVSEWHRGARRPKG